MRLREALKMLDGDDIKWVLHRGTNLKVTIIRKLPGFDGYHVDTNNGGHCWLAEDGWIEEMKEPSLLIDILNEQVITIKEDLQLILDRLEKLEE